MLVVNKRQIYLAVLLLVFTFSALPDEKRRIVAVFTEFTEGKDDEGIPLLSPAEKNIIQQSLSYQLQKADFFASFIEFPEKRNPDREEKRDYLYKITADSWLGVSINGNIDELDIKWELYDFIEEEIIINGEFTSSGGAYYFQLFGGTWKPVIDGLSDHLVPLEDTRIVRFLGKPETKISGLRDFDVELNDEGYIDINLPLYTTLRSKVTAPRTYDSDQVFYIDSNTETITLNQKNIYGFHLDLFLNDLNYPGFNFKFFPTKYGDDFYIGTSFTLYNFRLTPLYPSEEKQNIIYTNMQTGYRWKAGQNNFISTGIGFFERINLSYAEHVGIKGLEFELAPEIRLKPQFSLFASWNPRYYLIEDRYLFKSQVQSGFLNPYFIYFGDAGIELNNFKAGIRWIL